MNLFQYGSFDSHSGKTLPWKFECDALSLDDWVSIALIIVDMVGPFSAVEGVPRGGLWLASVLKPWASYGPLLIVDDVFTTGKSMETHRAGRLSAIGAVLLSRGPHPSWIKPVLQLGV